MKNLNEKLQPPALVVEQKKPADDSEYKTKMAELKRREFLLVARGLDAINPTALLGFINVDSLGDERAMKDAVERLKGKEDTRYLFRSGGVEVGIPQGSGKRNISGGPGELQHEGIPPAKGNEHFSDADARAIYESFGVDPDTGMLKPQKKSVRGVGIPEAMRRRIEKKYGGGK